MTLRLVLLIFSAIISGVPSAPSLEACPPDSILVEGNCTCNLDSCTKPPCLFDLLPLTNGSDLPGDCCPTYSCVGCKNETLIDGQCPCAEGAVLNEKGQCSCVAEGMELVDGVCQCNPDRCDLPIVCDDRSVRVSEDDSINKGKCCKQYKCIACPPDSFPTDNPDDELENHCVCHKCHYDCKNNQKVNVLKEGKGFPGECCDLYECQNNRSCLLENQKYESGATWVWHHTHNCTCEDGLAKCWMFNLNDQFCIEGDRIYKEGESWQDEICTVCTCKNGSRACISNYCDFEYKKKEFYKPLNNCTDDHEHNSSWNPDECTRCSCNNGTISCEQLCEVIVPPIISCQPLVHCHKKCENGFKIKNGCEICKCKLTGKSNELNRNVSKIKKNSTIHTTPATPTTTLVSPFFIGDTNEAINVACNDSVKYTWIIIGVLGLLVMLLLVITIFLGCYLCNYRQKQNTYDFDCKYGPISHNNNLIQKNNNE
ncbi:cysteine-rich motor neuron 1 protein [Aethina tumida]|uniref:cysteine-rich motor neuron 1 protein n=1 Tax=Aethina tumida TaxID=116153 RepID=UPI00214964D8|nr:cysteine-rich motor neuron 1 protein [Aethina tumida]